MARWTLSRDYACVSLVSRDMTQSHDAGLKYKSLILVMAQGMSRRALSGSRGDFVLLTRSSNYSFHCRMFPTNSSSHESYLIVVIAWLHVSQPSDLGRAFLLRHSFVIMIQPSTRTGAFYQDVDRSWQHRREQLGAQTHLPGYAVHLCA